MIPLLTALQRKQIASATLVVNRRSNMASSVDVTMSQSTADYALMQNQPTVLKRSAPPL